VTYSYTAQITFINDYNYNFPFPQSPDHLDLSDGTISAGGTFSGQFSYDTNTPLQQSPWAPNQYDGSAPTVSASAIFDNSTVKFKSTPGDTDSHISVDNDGPYATDAFWLMAHHSGGRSLQFNFYAADYNALPNNDIPASLSGFVYTQIYFGGNDALNGDSYTAFATITSMQQTSPVPEPETYAMMLAGLGLMAGLARRRARA
jgi:hypothetical protein